ncbi:hypothetical protein Mal4_16410 [Maioricimonas rarisocia]|uniref:Uncharacterized protein n=1 Tax=Maioricimonas rarisocia TaxID=2528026 RepID=A0A517Z4C2_9PLAN|nr:hypothetical protein [Maioricimonas rarisocia]QDU37331.1 hypothetical protein Mal4_16410 [Maioricimonas rarisocia]
MIAFDAAIDAVGHLDRFVKLRLVESGHLHYRAASTASEAVYFSIRRGDWWYGLRIAGHPPVYACSADYEQVLVPRQVRDVELLRPQEERIASIIESGGRIVASPEDVIDAIEHHLSRLRERTGAATLSNRDADRIRHQLHFRARWAHDEQAARPN